MKQRNAKKRTLAAKAQAAFEQASRKVIERARQTGTPIVVWKEGHIEEISAAQAGMALLQSQGIDQTP